MADKQVYQVLGRISHMITFQNKDDKVLPARAIFRSLPNNASVIRLLRAKPPAVRLLSDQEIPEALKAPNTDDVFYPSDV